MRVGCDVAVVGAGPAGSATARRLARHGLSVALLERSRFDEPRVGETLAPAVAPLLRDLGVWDRFRDLGSLPSFGTRSVWGAPAPEVHSHLMSAYGCGWHVDRRAFDQMLADAAADAGAVLTVGAAVRDCAHDGRLWTVTTTGGPAVTARLLVDATGRRAGVGRRLGAGRLPFDRLVGVAATVAAPVPRQYLLVETTAVGWWYTAPLPDGRIVGMLMTDADLCRAAALASAGSWRSHLARAPVTAARLGGTALAVPRVCPAASHRLRRTDRLPWLAVGDAALSVDPVSGSGVLRALRTAEAAAVTVVEMLTGSDSALHRYEAARDSECTAYLEERARYYGAEQRFATPFWSRRAVLREDSRRLHVSSAAIDAR